MDSTLFVTILALVFAGSSPTVRGQTCGQQGAMAFPDGCEGTACQYRAMWEVSGSDVEFTVVARQDSNLWTGIGLSYNTRMSESDVVVAYLTSSGQVALEDRYAPGPPPSYREPLTDTVQNVTPLAGGYLEGQLIVKFSRPLNTGDSNDVSFGPPGSTCPRLIFPVSGGLYQFNSNAGRYQISMHRASPLVSEPICLTPCTA